MEELRKAIKQSIICDIVFWILNFIITPLVIFFIYVCFTEDQGIIDEYVFMFTKTTRHGYEFIQFITVTFAVGLLMIYFCIVLINNILLYLKAIKDIKLYQYIDNGDVNSVITYSKKYNRLIKISLNPFFAVPDNKIRQVIATNPAFNNVMLYDNRRNIY